MKYEPIIQQKMQSNLLILLQRYKLPTGRGESKPVLLSGSGPPLYCTFMSFSVESLTVDCTNLPFQTTTEELCN
jgi:hypothetical protein